MTNEKSRDSMSGAITLEALLYRITTTVDGGWNITFSAGDDQSDAILKLSALRNTQLQFAIVPVNE